MGGQCALASWGLPGCRAAWPLPKAPLFAPLSTRAAAIVSAQSSVALTSRPRLWPGRGRVSQAPRGGCLLHLPGSWTPRPSASAPKACSPSPRQLPPRPRPHLRGDHRLTGPPLPTPGHMAGGSHARCWEGGGFRKAPCSWRVCWQAGSSGWTECGPPERRPGSGARLGSGQEGVSAGHLRQRRGKGGGRRKKKQGLRSSAPPPSLPLSPGSASVPGPVPQHGSWCCPAPRTATAESRR